MARRQACTFDQSDLVNDKINRKLVFGTRTYDKFNKKYKMAMQDKETGQLMHQRVNGMEWLEKIEISNKV